LINWRKGYKLGNVENLHKNIELLLNSPLMSKASSPTHLCRGQVTRAPVKTRAGQGSQVRRWDRTLTRGLYNLLLPKYSQMEKCPQRA
jgi:hypothetical protein